VLFGIDRTRAARLALAIVLVTVVVPIVVACAAMPCCQTGMMPIASLPGMHANGSFLPAACDMGQTAIQLPDALAGVSLTLVLLLIFGYAAAIIADVGVFAVGRLAPVPAAESPPPPEDPFGARRRL